jgi:hypothetical protein
LGQLAGGAGQLQCNDLRRRNPSSIQPF